MKKWYEDNKLSVSFGTTPSIAIRYALPSMSDQEIKSVKKYPFINKRDLEVRIENKENGRTHGFTIPKGYCFDGASVPKFFRRVIGAPTDNEFLVAALVHDYLCENKQLILNDRALSTNVFNGLLTVSEVSKFKRFLMKNSVACFQTIFCDWGLQWN